jgi:chitodextrinase
VAPLYRAYVYVDAISGKIIVEQQIIHTTNAPSTGATLYNGTVNITADYNGTAYQLRQTASGNGIETYTLSGSQDYTLAKDVTSSSSSFTVDSVANQAHWGAERTYDYFYTKHNRNSFDNAGGVIRSYVHYSTNYVNAFWDGSRMTYGDGDRSRGYKPLVAIDICGHEITHGITQFAAALTYSGESGALNESFSDIFGEAVEFYSKGSSDWLVGCDIGLNSCGAFRSLSNPNAYLHPDTYKGSYWYTGSADYGGVHTNSGVQNKWFYILVNGESGTNDLGNPYSVTGIGWDKAARIAYRNLTVYLSASSGFAAARVGSIQAAIDLYGAGSPEVIATTNAWYAVGVGCAFNTICYCGTSGNSQTDEWIAGVTIGSFSNTSSKSSYTFFSAKTITLVPGSTNTFQLTPGFSGSAFPEYWRIWIDYNKDNDFEDSGEMVYDAGSGSTSARSGSFVVPATVTGNTRMRVSMRYYYAPTPCMNFDYGEVEDYPVSFIQTFVDNQPPTAPVLTSSNLSFTSVNLNWSASTDNVGVSGYDVFVNGVKNNTTLLTGLSYALSGLQSGTSYSVYVTARDSSGNTANSNTLSIQTPVPDTQPPSIPVLSAPAKTTTTIDLSWTAATDNVGVTGYDVFVNGIKNNSNNLQGFTYTINGLNPSTTYSIYVMAKDSSGNVSVSSTISVTTLSIDTQPPTAPVVSSPSKAQTTIDLSWTASTDNVVVTGYDIYVEGVKNNATLLTALSYTVTGLTASTIYSIYVVARDAAGNSTNSNTLSITTMSNDIQPPSAPVLTSSSRTQTSINLSWTAATDNIGVTGYDVFVGGIKNNTSLLTGLTYTVSGLTASTSYSVYVVARDAAGNRTNSNTLSVTTLSNDTQAPSAPVLSSSGKTETSISLSWTAATDNVGVSGYDVFVGGVKNNASILTSLTYTVSGLTAATAYSIYVVARDQAGNATSSNTLSISTNAAVSETLVSSYYYVSTLENWASSSTSNCFWLNNSAWAFEGSGSMQLQSKNTTATSPSVNLSGFSQAEVKFYFTSSGIEAGKKFTISYSTGTNTYTTIATFTAAATYSGLNFANSGAYYCATVTMNATNLSSTARFRFTINGNDASDKLFIDAVTVKGRKNTTGTGNLAVLSQATKGVLTLSNNSVEKKFTTESFAVNCYPNPAGNYLRIVAPDLIRAVRIWNIAGQQMSAFRASLDNRLLDISALDPGWYLIELGINGGTVMKKFIKQ